MGGRRRRISLEGVGAASLPSPLTARRPALRQLLASRLLHPGHQRHGAAEAGGRRQYLAGLSASDAHMPADSGAVEGPQDHGGRRRGRGQAVAGGARFHLDLRHHRRTVPGADRDLSGGGPGSGRRAAAAHDGLPPAVGALQRHRHTLRLGCYEADPPEGFELASSNDVTQDSRGLLYLVDRQRGVDIIEAAAFQ
jgi:hypothetical protein